MLEEIIFKLTTKVNNITVVYTYCTLLKAHSIMIVIPLHIYATVENSHLEGTYLKLNKIKHLQL